MPTFYLGIDVVKAKLDCALRYPTGKVRIKIVPNTPQGYAELLGGLSYKQALDVTVQPPLPNPPPQGGRELLQHSYSACSPSPRGRGLGGGGERLPLDVHVCMEATGVYWEEVAQFLATQDLTVRVVDPAQIKAYAASRLTRSKTDALDARLIAEFCAERQPPPWQARPEAEITLRALVLRLDALQTMRIQESNRLGVANEAVRSVLKSGKNFDPALHGA